MSYDIISILLLPIANTVSEPKYKNAVQAIQSVSWKKSELKKDSEIAAKYVYKKHPKTVTMLASAYLIGVKKEVGFDIKKALPIKGSKVSINFNYKNLSGFVSVTVPISIK